MLLKIGSLGFVFTLTALPTFADFPRVYSSVEYEDAVRLAKQDGKPIMVFYTLPFCTPCNVQKGFLDTSRARSALVGNYHFTDVNTRSIPEALRKQMNALSNFGFGIGAPQIAVLDKDSRLVCGLPRGFNNGYHIVAVHQWLVNHSYPAATLDDHPYRCGTA